jgi:AbiV family abortive infection protein
LREQLTSYKFRRIATEALANGLRLHFDSILLYKNHSYPTSLQISIIALEEIAKAEWIEHYYFSSITNNGFPDKNFEQKWLRLLYLHPRKQIAFINRNPFEFSPKFVNIVMEGKLDQLKQKATYVGLEKKKNKVNVNSRISTPKKISSKESKKLISLLNDSMIEVCEMKLFQECHYGIEEMDSLLSQALLDKLHSWKFKSGIKSIKWFSKNILNKSSS